MRTFGSSTPPTVHREEVKLWVTRDGEQVEEKFTVAVGSDWSALKLASVGDRDPMRGFDNIFRVIAKGMDNKDGVRAQWKPEPLPLPTPEDRAADGTYGEEHDAAAQVAKFRNPDGQLEPYTAENVAKYTDLAAGSSRRRWLHLIEEDDDAAIQQEALMGLYEYMISLAADRPMVPSS